MNWEWVKGYFLYYYLLKYGGLLLLLVWAFSKDPKAVNTIHHFNHPKDDSSDIRLMSFNLGFAGGLNNLDGSVHSRGKIKRNLASICETVKANNINVLAVQEIDIKSRRSWFINQVKYIAKECEFPYVAVAITWNKKWVPYPTTWKLWKHYGKVLAAQAVFSKYPITSQEILMFDKPKSRSYLYRLFYLDRLTQFVSIKLPSGQNFSLGNLHLEAFDKACRQKQSVILMDYIKQNHTETPLILAGDFNAIFPKSSSMGPFPDEPKIDYKNDITLLNLNKIPFLKEGFFQHRYPDVEFNTFPANNPNRQLDHFFYSDSFQLVESKVLPMTHPFPSDHLPFVTELTIQ